MNICVNSWAKIFLLVGGLVVEGYAELQWEKKTVQLDLHPLQVTGTVEFPFKNSGTNTVDILSVRTTCGCLKASASTNQIPAGESGAIRATYDFRDKTGPQRKGVAVRTSDSAPAILYIQANIPEVYALSVKRLEWSLDSVVATMDSGDAVPPGSVKTCRLINQSDDSARLISVTSSIDSFHVELVPIRDGFEYEVSVTPTPEAQPCKSTITIQTECPPELKESRSYTFSAVLR